MSNNNKFLHLPFNKSTMPNSTSQAGYNNNSNIPEWTAHSSVHNLQGTNPQDSPIQHSPSTNIKPSDTSQLKPIMSISNIIPEFLVDKITLMAYELEPHPTASIIKPLDKWNGYDLWYKFCLKNYLIRNINKCLKDEYYQYLDMSSTYLKSDDEPLDKFMASPIYDKMTAMIGEVILSNEEHIQSIKCDNIQNGISNENLDKHYIVAFIEDHLYNIACDMKFYDDY